ncbi:MAG: hypothetical protein JSW08_01130 [archaeon]|nr:MAG: hypothetical protein JSW08_01130 [archaeon]
MVVKKKFYDVELEIIGLKVPVIARDPETLIGQTVKYDITKILRGKNCESRFKIKKTNGKLKGEIYFFKIQPSFIRKMIGRNISIVEDSFVVKGPNVSIRIKPFLITRRQVHRTVRKALRDGAAAFIKKRLEDKTRDKVFQDVISASLQRNMSKFLKKIYPLAVSEIRMLKVEPKH